MIEMLVALNVTDDSSYQKYREGMTPLLQSYGGGFGYDFRVSEVLKSESNGEINRVFTIFFPSKEVMGTFFSDSQYLDIKKRYFNESVASTTIISTYRKE